MTGTHRALSNLGRCEVRLIVRLAESGEQDIAGSSANNATRRINPPLANSGSQGVYVPTALCTARIGRTDSRSARVKAGSKNAHRPLSGWSIDGDLPLKPTILLHTDSLWQGVRNTLAYRFPSNLPRDEKAIPEYSVIPTDGL
jgi:hypothetical protein